MKLIVEKLIMLEHLENGLVDIVQKMTKYVQRIGKVGLGDRHGGDVAKIDQSTLWPFSRDALAWLYSTEIAF